MLYTAPYTSAEYHKVIQKYEIIQSMNSAEGGMLFGGYRKKTKYSSKKK